MKVSKIIFKKVIVIAIAFVLVGPSFLSATVYAIESKDTPKNESDSSQINEEVVEETTNIENEKSEDSLKIDTTIKDEDQDRNLEIEEETVPVNKEETIVESEKISEDSLIEDESGDFQTPIGENQLNQNSDEVTENKEYYSAEEVREQALEMMEVDNNNINTYSLRAKSISKTDAFINATSPYAISIANEKGLYPSVMLAQAALESAWGTSILAYNPNYNYFGIKGNYKNNYFSTYTKEYSDKDGWYVIKANFKKYGSVSATFTDYANKLTRGPAWDSKNGSWDKNFYSGTWRKNTKSYKDATKSLLNKYATDPKYNIKLNNIIEAYDLTRFDKMTSSDSNGSNLEENLANINYDEVISTKNVKEYSMRINSKSDGIYTAPKGTKNSKIFSTTMEYLGEKVIVVEEKKTKNGLNWSRIKLNGKVLGWIDSNGLTGFDVKLSEKNVNYRANVIRKTDGINTLPYGLEGSNFISRSSTHYKKNVKITKEMTTTRTTWAYIDGVGWIDKKGLDIERIISSRPTSYYKRINRKTDGINTQPWGTKGSTLNSMSSNYYGKKVEIIKEATTQRSTWAYITLDGKVLGWIDKSGLTSYDVILSEKKANYRANIIRKTDGINTLPYGLEGSKFISRSSAYYKKNVKITKEMTTTRTTWAYIDGIGWIDKKGLDIERIISSRPTSYYKRINRKTDGINTQPWGTNGSALNSMSSNYYGKKVKIIKEATTQRSTWAYITLDGKVLGWIDKSGLTSYDVILSEKKANYRANIIRKTDGINTLPYGLEGSKFISRSSAYYKKNVKITKEMTTTRTTWAYIDGIGWIDKKGLDIERIISSRPTSYYKRINRKTDGINTQPWGTNGSALNSMSSNYYGKKVKIIKEATTQRSTWAYISLDGKALGWIDAKGLTSSDVILSQKNINYTGEITRKTDGINTLPYGVAGSKLVTMSSAYYGKNVTISKEMVTTRATWVYIYFEGKALGWIDKKGLKRVDLFKKVVVLDPGHGGKDPGAQAGGIREKDLNLTVAKKVQLKLEKAGYEVVMTRSTDKFLALSEIAATANRANPDIFVSIHTNSFNKSSHGIETYSYNANGKPNNIAIANNPKRLLNSSSLSKGIQNSLISNTKAYNRGAKKANFHVIRETWMPAVLVEIGFVDNTSERSKLVTNNYQEKLASGVFGGIQNYFKELR